MPIITKAEAHHEWLAQAEARALALVPFIDEEIKKWYHPERPVRFSHVEFATEDVRAILCVVYGKAGWKVRFEEPDGDERVDYSWYIVLE